MNAWPENWTPVHYANLCFVLDGEQVLLIRKKRGLGAGKINGPGGKLDPGETALESAIREVEEELGIVPQKLEDRGVIRFQFTDGYSLHCAIFIARAYEGTPIETPEAIPLWTPISAIPYHEMWEDDRHWLPQVLAGATINAWFVFDGEKMLWNRIEFGQYCQNEL